MVLTHLIEYHLLHPLNDSLVSVSDDLIYLLVSRRALPHKARLGDGIPIAAEEDAPLLAAFRNAYELLLHERSLVR